MLKLPPDANRLAEAAKGWLMLGNPLEANAELERIAPQLRAHPFVSDVRWRIYAQGGHWDTAVELAGAVMKAAPKYRAEIMYALAVHACRLKRTEDARHWLGEALNLGGKKMKLRALDDRALESVWRKA